MEIPETNSFYMGIHHKKFIVVTNIVVGGNLDYAVIHYRFITDGTGITDFLYLSAFWKYYQHYQ